MVRSKWGTRLCTRFGTAKTRDTDSQTLFSRNPGDVEAEKKKKSSFLRFSERYGTLCGVCRSFG